VDPTGSSTPPEEQLSIHSEHPFAAAAQDRDQVRRFRGRLGGQVSLWTAGTGAGRTGMTVSSLVVGGGEPGFVVGLLDPDCDLADDLAQGTPFVVQLLGWRDRDLAEQFAGLMPAPGGPFRAAQFVDTGFGPRLAGATTWAGARVVETHTRGWSLVVTADLEEVHVGEDREPLGHRRGHWTRLDG